MLAGGGRGGCSASGARCVVRHAGRAPALAPRHDGLQLGVHISFLQSLDLVSDEDITGGNKQRKAHNVRLAPLPLMALVPGRKKGRKSSLDLTGASAIDPIRNQRLPERRVLSRDEQTRKTGFKNFTTPG